MTGWLLLISIIPTGCTTLHEWNNTILSLGQESPLVLVTRMNELDERKERDRIARAVLAEYKIEPSDRNMLRLAIVRSFPGHDLHDDKEAIVLLESLDHQDLSKSEQRLVDWLDANLKQRIALRELNSALREDLSSVQAALARAREKIEILTRIEQTMGPNAETSP